MNSFWAHHSDGEIYRALKDFLATRIGVDGFSDGTIMAVTDGPRVVAAVLFHNYQPDAQIVELSAASDSKRWLTRPVLRDLFGYAFNDLKCQAVVARIDPENASLARIFAAYGFERYDIPRLRGRNKGEAILILTDEAWHMNGFHERLRNVPPCDPIAHIGECFNV